MNRSLNKHSTFSNQHGVTVDNNKFSSNQLDYLRNWYKEFYLNSFLLVKNAVRQKRNITNV